MSDSALEYISLKDGTITKTLSRKHKKKRRRNKLKSYNLRKKRLKKYTQVSFTTNNSKLNSGSGKVMSNWYWTNYKKAMEWQKRHEVAHWKATALALYEENRYLWQIIHNMQQDIPPNMSGVQTKFSNLKENKFKIHPVISECVDQKSDTDEEDEPVEEDAEEHKQEDYEENDEPNDEEDEFEIEMSEEMMKFFEESYKRKMDLKKLKEKELLKTTEQEVEQIKINKVKRTSEMNFLYGDGASMITGMETAVQLSFDKYCDSKSPKYWPNIPFRL